MRLFFGKKVDKFLKISDTSASKELEQFVVAVTWLWNVHKVFSLWPRDTSESSKFSEKGNARIDIVQQLNTIESQLAHSSFV